MTVDDLVAEGDSFRLAHPSASPKRVRAHLEGLFGGTPGGVRDDLGRSALWGVEGCLVALLVMPLVAAGHALRLRRHRVRIDRVMAELFPAGRKRRAP